MDFGETQYANAGDVDIAYRVFGDGPMDVVIVPGIFSHLDLFFTFDIFCDFMARFGSFARVVTFDKRGTGLSDPTPGANENDDRMDDIRAVMDAVGMESAAIVGISEGGSLALMFAATYPQRTRAVVICGSYCRVPPGSRLERLFQTAMDQWGTGALTLALSPGLEKSSLLVRRSVGFMERASASPRMARELGKFVKTIDTRPVLASVQAPVLAVHRRDEVVDLALAQEVIDGVPDGRLVALEGDDHLPWVGNSNEYVDVIEEFLTGTKHQVEPERGLSTVLFTDIVSSTNRNAELGDDAWRRLLDRHNELVRAALADHRGREIKTIGDGFLSTFDGPARALRCAKAIVEGVSELGIQVRAGLHTGEVELYPDGDIGGMAVNLGARVGAAAEGGEVLVSSTIKDLVFGSGFRFVPRGEHELKGVPGSWPLFALEGEGHRDAPAEAADDHLGPIDKARVRLAQRSPRTSRAISRLIMRGADESLKQT
jgi:class 3 adenylate cyclase/alpha-beta hydrolase superfamily lysophospholipase